MKRASVFAMAMVFGIAAILAFGQKPPKDAPKYDAAHEVTIKGVVQEIKDFECPASGGMGAHLVVKTPDQTVVVHLALSKFLREYGFDFAKGDEVVVLGAKAKIGNEEGVLARKIDRGNQSFNFRDKDGKPLW